MSTPETAEQIERELAALGEEPPSAEELAWLEDLRSSAQEPERDPDIATVARLTELARADAAPSLSELELQQAWRKLEQPTRAREATGKGGAGRGRWWLLAATGLAAAAALVIAVLPRESESEPSAAELAELGEQVRASLQAFDDGKSDSERASERAAAYQRRLAAKGERGG